ncbi:hypothetical protein JKF63_04146 [Porcisia hertigi]|uniref:Uncharacterized protein n=1 Tax=Porcisia hertigi TaxID=2761500 RepID=A0A836L7K1_9TRYP|nr:hypothetical protein JKF63_04146 [Porcisia hertigi]
MGGQTTSVSRRRSPNQGGAPSGRSVSARHTNVTLATAHTGGYVIHMGQHPLYTGKGSTERQRTGLPSAAGKATGAQGSLSISAETNTVRRLQGCPVAVAKSAPARVSVASVEGVPVGAVQTNRSARHGSVIEQLAAITQMTNSHGPPVGQAAHQLCATNSTETPSSACRQPPSNPDGELGLWSHADGGHSKALGPLRLHDVMRMHLQQEPFNVGTSAAGEVGRRLPNETLVLPSPQTTPDGKENSMYADLKTFRLPQRVPAALQTPTPPPLPTAEATAGTSTAPVLANPTAGPSGVGAAAGPGSSSAPTPAAGIPASVLSPASPGADIVGAAALAAPAATGTALQPPPLPTPQQEIPAVAGTTGVPTASASVADTAAPVTATASGSPIPGQPVPQRRLKREEKANREEEEEERLLHDLIATSHHRQQRANLLHSSTIDEVRAALLLARQPKMNFFAPGTASVVSSTNTDLAAALVARVQLRREANGGALDGWWRPPLNVLLPDPTQSAPTWTVLKSASAQAEQQVAAAAALARPARESSLNHPASADDGEKVAAPEAAGDDGGGGEAPQAPYCMDYHAPFQCVQSPEYIEHHVVPMALKAVAGAGTSANGLKTKRLSARNIADAAPAAAVEQRDDAQVDLRATATAAGSASAAKTLGEQAVILRDPFSLLACEHLAEETINIAARRRAYLSAVNTMDSITRCGASSPTSPGALASMLRNAMPPGEVFCELSYAAKVLLSAILYMRALGALPSLLRVGPLTEYSPVVDKQNCIELVFYNPSDKERRELEAQEQQRQSEQLERSRHISLKERPSGSLVFYNQAPAARMPLVAAVTPTKAPTRARSLPSTKGHPCGNPDASLGNRSRSQSGNDHRTSADNVTPEDDAQPRQRLPSAIEKKLMRTLSSTAARRASSLALDRGGAPAALEPTVSPHRTSRSSFTSLAGPQLHSVDASLMTGDIPGGALCSPGTGRGKALRSDSGGAWLLRSTSRDGSASRDSAHRAGDGVTNIHGSLGSSDDAHHRCVGTTHSRQHLQGTSQQAPIVQRRGSECTGALVGGVPHVCLTHSPGASQISASHAASTTAVTKGTFASALRRSSVTVALEDLQRVVEESRLPGAMNDSASAPSSPPHSPLGRTKLFADVTQPIRSMPPPPTQHESMMSPITRAAEGAEASAGGAKPATAYGPGSSRFVKGEQELCVVLRAVIAQKSHVYSFGKAETVHVLPPLPLRSATDSGDADKTLLRKQANQKTAELERLAVGTSNPLFKFLSNSSSRQRKDPDGGQWRDALRARARCSATAARQRDPITVNEHGVPTAEDYGDLVVAFLLSGNASELSGSVPDMMELEALRYHIFSLLGYNVSDPAGVQAVKEAAAGGKASAAPRQPAAANTQPATSPSAPESGVVRLPQHLAAFTAFETPTSSHPRAREMPPGSPSLAPSASRTPVVREQQRSSFFETALRRMNPVADLTEGEGGRGHRLTKAGVHWRKKVQKEMRPQEIQALMQRRFPIYRASSVAESTLQAFFTEAKAAVAAAHLQRRRRGHAGSSSGGRVSPSGVPFDSLEQRAHADAKETALQDAERDLLRFRPMNLNSFHRELADALQYALDLQIREGKENVLRAFHM